MNTCSAIIKVTANLTQTERKNKIKYKNALWVNSVLLQCTLFLHASSFIRSSLASCFLFPLLVRLCTKYEMHREGGENKRQKKKEKKRNTIARGRTWTGSLCWGENGLVLRLFISLSDYLFTTLSGERAVGFKWMTDQSPWSKHGGWGWGGTIASELGEDVLRGTTSRILAVKGTNLKISRIGWGQCGVDGSRY